MKSSETSCPFCHAAREATLPAAPLFPRVSRAAAIVATTLAIAGCQTEDRAPIEAKKDPAPQKTASSAKPPPPLPSAFEPGEAQDHGTVVAKYGAPPPPLVPTAPAAAYGAPPPPPSSSAKKP